MVSICLEMDDQCDESFLNSLTEEEEPVTVDSVDEQEDFNAPPPVPKIKSFKEAVQLVFGGHSNFRRPWLF